MAATDIKNDATLSTSLISCWMTDLSGLLTDLVTASGNDLTNNNSVTKVAGVQGDAGDFELADSEFLDITDAAQTGLDITTDISFACWLKFETVAGELSIATKTDSSQISYQLKHEDGLNWAFVISGDGSAVEKYEKANVPSTGVDLHFAISLDISEKTATFYVDGSSIGTDATGTTATIHSGTAPFRIGAGTSGGANFDGIINQMLIWNKAITSDEVSDLYNSGTGIPFEAVTTFIPSMQIF